MRYLLIAITVALAGCATSVPVVIKFPEAPDVLMEKCSELKMIEGDTTTLSNLIKTVTINYTAYHECAVKQEAWTEWYQSQKKIFEEVK